MVFFFFQAEDGIRDGTVTGVQTCALPISSRVGPHLPLHLLKAEGREQGAGGRVVGPCSVDVEGRRGGRSWANGPRHKRLAWLRAAQTERAARISSSILRAAPAGSDDS